MFTGPSGNKAEITQPSLAHFKGKCRPHTPSIEERCRKPMLGVCVGLGLFDGHLTSTEGAAEISK